MSTDIKNYFDHKPHKEILMKTDGGRGKGGGEEISTDIATVHTCMQIERRKTNFVNVTLNRLKHKEQTTTWIVQNHKIYLIIFANSPVTLKTGQDHLKQYEHAKLCRGCHHAQFQGVTLQTIPKITSFFFFWPRLPAHHKCVKYLPLTNTLKSYILLCIIWSMYITTIHGLNQTWSEFQ